MTQGQNSSSDQGDFITSIKELVAMTQAQTVEQRNNAVTLESLSHTLSGLTKASMDQMQLLQAQLGYQQKSADVLSMLTQDQIKAQSENTRVLRELLSQSNSPLSQAVASIASTNPGNIQEVAASQLAIVNSYYQGGLEQSKQSFRWSLIWCGFGLGFFLIAVCIILFQQSPEISIISAISGAIIEISASTYLLLHRRASDQLSTFRSSLESTQWILLANSMCENLEGEAKQNTRAEIIRMIVDGAVHKQPPEPSDRKVSNS